MNTRVQRRKRQQPMMLLLGLLPSCSGFAGFGGQQLLLQQPTASTRASWRWSTMETPGTSGSLLRMGSTSPLENTSMEYAPMEYTSMENTPVENSPIVDAQKAGLQDILNEAIELASLWEGYSTSQLSGLAKGILQQFNYIVENSPTGDSEPEELVLHSQRVKKLEGHLEVFFGIIRARETGASLLIPKRTDFQPVNPPKQRDEGKSSSSEVLHFVYKRTPQEEQQQQLFSNTPVLGSVEEEMQTSESVNEVSSSSPLSSVDEDVPIISLDSSTSEDDLETPELDIEKSTAPLLEAAESSVVEDVPIISLESSVSEDDLETELDIEKSTAPLLEAEESSVVEDVPIISLESSVGEDDLETPEVDFEKSTTPLEATKKELPTSPEAEEMELLEIGETFDLQPLEVSVANEAFGAQLHTQGGNKEGNPVEDEQSPELVVGSVPALMEGGTQDQPVAAAAAAAPFVVKAKKPLPFFATLVTQGEKEEEKAVPVAQEKLEKKSLLDRLDPEMAARPLFGKLRKREVEPDLDVVSILKRLEEGFRRKNPPKKVTVAPVKAETLIVPKKETVQQAPPQEDLPSKPLLGEVHWSTKQDWEIPAELTRRPRLADRQLVRSTDDKKTVDRQLVRSTDDETTVVVVDDDVEMPFYDNGPLLGKNNTEEVMLSKKARSLWGGKTPVFLRKGHLFGVQRQGGRRGGPLFGVGRFAATETPVRPRFGVIDKAIVLLLVIKLLNPGAAATTFGISKTNVLAVYVVTMFNLFYFNDKFDAQTNREKRFTSTFLWMSRFVFAFFGLR